MNAKQRKARYFDKKVKKSRSYLNIKARLENGNKMSFNLSDIDFAINTVFNYDSKPTEINILFK